jgi:hypothetical protein
LHASPERPIRVTIRVLALMVNVLFIRLRPATAGSFRYPRGGSHKGVYRKRGVGGSGAS